MRRGAGTLSRGGGVVEEKFASASDVDMHDMVSFPAGFQGRGEEGWWWDGLLSFSFFSTFGIKNCTKGFSMDH